MPAQNRFRFSCREPIMPFKLHSKGRRHIPRQRHRVTNWREYDVCLRSRGSLTIWFTPDAIAGWKAQPRTTPGGQRHYSNLAIETALTLRAVFRLALRQSEGLIGSIVRMLEIDLPVPVRQEGRKSVTKRLQHLDVFHISTPRCAPAIRCSFDRR